MYGLARRLSRGLVSGCVIRPSMVKVLNTSPFACRRSRRTWQTATQRVDQPNLHDHPAFGGQGRLKGSRSGGAASSARGHDSRVSPTQVKASLHSVSTVQPSSMPYGVTVTL